MLTVTATTTRPNTESPWFHDADTSAAAILETARKQSEVQSSSTSVSSDGLTFTGVLTFNNSDDYFAWTEKLRVADPLFLVKRNDHIVNNNQTLKIEEVTDGAPPVVEKLI